MRWDNLGKRERLTKPEGNLYVGMFLIQHGQGKDAAPYLEHPHQPQLDITRAIAASLLRELTKQ